MNSMQFLTEYFFFLFLIRLLEQTAASIIERAWIAYRDRHMFRLLKHAVCAAVSQSYKKHLWCILCERAIHKIERNIPTFCHQHLFIEYLIVKHLRFVSLLYPLLDQIISVILLSFAH